MAALWCSPWGVSPAAAQLAAPQQAQAQRQTPAFKVGTVTIKFVGTANVNEQVIRANMQIREGGEFDEVILDRDIRSLYRTGLFEFIEVKHDAVDATTSRPSRTSQMKRLAGSSSASSGIRWE